MLLLTFGFGDPILGTYFLMVPEGHNLFLFEPTHHLLNPFNRLIFYKYSINFIKSIHYDMKIFIHAIPI